MSDKKEKVSFPIFPFFSWAITKEEILEFKKALDEYDFKAPKTLCSTDFVRLQIMPLDNNLFTIGVQCAANSTRLSKEEIKTMIDKNPELKDLVEKIKKEAN